MERRGFDVLLCSVSPPVDCERAVKRNTSSVALVKAQLDGAWLGSCYVITDVIDKESYSNAPCIRPGAAQLVIG